MLVDHTVTIRCKLELFQPNATERTAVFWGDVVDEIREVHFTSTEEDIELLSITYAEEEKLLQESADIKRKI